MMKRIILICCAAVTAFCCTACSNTAKGGSSAGESKQQADGLKVTCSNDMDQAYADLMKSYFEAIEHKDYAAYQKIVYPPYQESYGKFLESQGTDPETTFREDLCTQFDEDGYDGWTLTELQIEYYPPERRILTTFSMRIPLRGSLTMHLSKARRRMLRRCMMCCLRCMRSMTATRRLCRSSQTAKCSC